MGPGLFAWKSLVVVDVFVRAPDNHCNSNSKCITNPQKRRHCNRTTSFDLLPMASGESETNHILLAVATPFAEFLDALAKSFEKFDVIYHAATFYFCLTRNTTSRLAASASGVGLLEMWEHVIFVIVHSLNSMPGLTRLPSLLVLRRQIRIRADLELGVNCEYWDLRHDREKEKSSEYYEVDNPLEHRSAACPNREKTDNERQGEQQFFLGAEAKR